MTGPVELIKTDPVAMGVWLRLRNLFAAWRAILFAGFSRRALYQFSNDQLTPLTRASHWKLGLGLLGGLSDAQLGFLKTYAELNALRVDRIFRVTALILVTLPVGILVGLNELQPGIWERFGFSEIEGVITTFGVWLMLSGYLMVAAWRARDMADLIAFEIARRELADAKGPGQ